MIYAGKRESIGAFLGTKKVLAMYLGDTQVYDSGGVYYTVTANIDQHITAQVPAKVADGGSLSVQLTADEKYAISVVSVTMGNEVVSGAYDSATGIVSIASVAGDVVITATAVEILSIIGQSLKHNIGLSAQGGASSPARTSTTSSTTRDSIFGFDLRSVFPSNVTKVKINRTAKIVIGLGTGNTSPQNVYYYAVGNCVVGTFAWIEANAGDIIIPLEGERTYLFMNLNKSANADNTIYDYLTSIEPYTT